jgi:phage terminase large subunit-like protein
VEQCGFTLSGVTCDKTGNHFCDLRANHAKAFIESALVHTKGKYARQQFLLKDWQFNDIVAPIFGTTEYSEEHQCYRRQYSIAWIEIARKNGKSELLAAMMLYVLFCDGEYSAELFSVATDRKQAGAIFDVAMNMTLLNPKLAIKCKPVASQKRLVRQDKNSVYAVLANDGASALGSNPSAVAADEVLAWPNGGMWTALRSGMGSMARVQPLFIAATTAGNDSESFGGQEHREMQKILDEPHRAPHIFVYMRNTPYDADPFDEKNWYYANPALGDFLSLEEMRKMALEAKNNPAKLNSFRQFQLNQWVSSAVAWMPMHLWDQEGNLSVQYPTRAKLFDAFAGRECWFGFDLAARQDLSSMCYLFPSETGVDVLWRHWCPESAYYKLDSLNSGRFTEWVKQGWLTVTEGDVLDFEQVYTDIESDSKRFTILGGDADQWSSDPVIQEIERRLYVPEIFAYKNDFAHMSDGMHRIYELVTEGNFRHHGNPLARFCFDACEARLAKYDPDLLRPDKPDRNTAAKRIDAVPAAVMAINAYWTRGNDGPSVYESREMLSF